MTQWFNNSVNFEDGTPATHALGIYSFISHWNLLTSFQVQSTKIGRNRWQQLFFAEMRARTETIQCFGHSAKWHNINWILIETWIPGVGVSDQRKFAPGNIHIYALQNHMFHVSVIRSAKWVICRHSQRTPMSFFEEALNLRLNLVV